MACDGIFGLESRKAGISSCFSAFQLYRPESDDKLGNFLPNTIEPDQPKSQQSNAGWFGNRSYRSVNSPAKVLPMVAVGFVHAAGPWPAAHPNAC